MHEYIRQIANTINIPNDGSDARETSSPAGNDADILIGVLGCTSLPVSCVIKVGDSLPECYKVLVTRKALG
jgi:hypothetical protein